MIDTEFADLHPVMVYAPRDEEEVEVVSQIVTASFEYARGAPG